MIKTYLGSKSWDDYFYSEERKKGSTFLVYYGKQVIDNAETDMKTIRNILNRDRFIDVTSGSLLNGTWLYIDIEHRVYFKGKIGVEIAKAIGGHALTPTEFLTIYDIYKKYEDKPVLSF